MKFGCLAALFLAAGCSTTAPPSEAAKGEIPAGAYRMKPAHVIDRKAKPSS